MEAGQWNIEIDLDSIEQARHLKQQMDEFQARMDKMNDMKGEVRDAVYQKVFDDYHQRFGDLEQQFKGQCEHLKKDALQLLAEQVRCKEALDQLDDRKEELKLRHTLGELSENSYVGPDNANRITMDELRDIETQLQNNLNYYVELLGQDIIDQLRAPEDEQAAVQHEQTIKASPKQATDNLRLMSEDAQEVEALGVHSKSFQEASEPEVAPVDSSDKEAPVEPGQDAADVDDATQQLAQNVQSTLIVHHPDGRSTSHPLSGEKITIGRIKQNDLIFASKSVSRHHADLIFESRGYVIRDLQSSNGTFVNKQKVADQPLKEGDQIQIGQWCIEFHST